MFAFENAINIRGCLPELVLLIEAVGTKTTALDKSPQRIDRGQPISCGEPAIEEKPKLSRFSVSGFFAQTVNGAGASAAMEHYTAGRAGAGVCYLMGVNPTTAIIAATALVDGVLGLARSGS